jgi:hydroxypyruvate isomerase
MDRKKFLKTGLLTGSAMLAGTGSMTDNVRKKRNTQNNFKLNYAPHFGMFQHHAGKDPVDQLKFMAARGFTALEDNGMKNRDVATQKRIAEQMEALDMQMGVFVAHKIYWQEPNLASGNENRLTEFLADIKDSIEVARRVNAKWMTVVPGHVDLRKDTGYQTANVIEALRRASDILEPHGLIMVLEPLNPRDHPGQFLKKIPQAYQICRAVDSPSCKILFDIYHQQVAEGNILANVTANLDKIGHIHVADVPGRHEPGTGELHYPNILAALDEAGYDGTVGFEFTPTNSEEEAFTAIRELLAD